MATDNQILIKGGSYNDVKKALQQWIDLYANDLQDGLSFELYKNGRGNHVIVVDERIDNERFFYLVNYLYYPEEIEYKIDIEGFTTGRDENIFKNQNLLVYISPNDKDADNVFVVTADNKNYKVDFGGRISEAGNEKLFQIFAEQNFTNPEILTLRKKQDLPIDQEKTEDSLTKRFKIISRIVLSVALLSYLVLKSPNTFLTINFAIGFAVWVWLILDYTLLQVNRLYFFGLGLSILIFIHGYYWNNQFPDEDKSRMMVMGTMLPFFLLIIQRPLRFLFKGIINREPVVDRPVPSIADFFYIVILWMVSMFIPSMLLI